MPIKKFVGNAGKAVADGAAGVADKANEIVVAGANAANDILPEDAETNLMKVMDTAAQVPGVKIDRSQYLRKALNGYFSMEVIEKAIETSPAKAGISPAELDDIANRAINYETTKVTALSAIAGIPGGLAMLGSVPADFAQYIAHVLRITQKLAYLYGWENIFDTQDEEFDEETRNLVILFVGIMFGVNGATDAIAKISEQAAMVTAKRLSQKALTKGVVYPLVKKVAQALGVKMTKDIFAKGAAKALPILGAALSGGITFATYKPMCRVLKDNLSSLSVANPETYLIETECFTTEEDATQFATDLAIDTIGNSEE